MKQPVVCFDRDQTVDISEGPVPLSWVQWLAHDSESRAHVWATGNQHLCKEASIPGVSMARNLWEAHFEEDIENEYENEGYYSYKPARREGLRMVRDVYEAYAPDQEFSYVVIDDENLQDMNHEGWVHFYPEDFVRAVREGIPKLGPLPLDGGDAPGDPCQAKHVDYGDPQEMMADGYVDEITG